VRLEGREATHPLRPGRRRLVRNRRSGEVAFGSPSPPGSASSSSIPSWPRSGRHVTHRRMSFAKRRSVAGLSPGAGLEGEGCQPRTRLGSPSPWRTTGRRAGTPRGRQSRPPPRWTRSGPSEAKRSQRNEGLEQGQRSRVANLVAWDGIEPPTRGFSERLAPPDQTEPNGTNRPECGTYGPPAGRLGTVGAVWRRLVRGKSEASRGSPGPSKKRQGSFGLDRELPLQVVEVDLARHILANRGLACNRPARWWPGTAMRIGLESSSAPPARRQGRPPRAVAADETGQPPRDRLEPFEDTMGVPRLGSLQERPRSGPASRRSLIFPRRSGLTSPHEKPGRSL
jgi:hypothetical protein